MISTEELEPLLREKSMCTPEFDMPQTVPGQTTVLDPDRSIRPGDMLAVHVHPSRRIAPLPEDQWPDAHRHDFIELAYVWAYDCGMEVEGKPFLLETGDFVILDTNSAHRIFDRDETLLINLDIRTEFFNDAFFRHFEKDDALAEFFANTIFSEKTARRYLVFRTGNDPKIRQLFTMILQEYFSQEVCCRPILENLVTILFIAMVRLQRQARAEVTDMAPQEETRVSSLLRFMNDNLENVTRDMLAEHFSYSYSYIASILHSATGMTFSQLKKTLRIQRAEMLLRTTDRPISLVAQDSGFSNLSAFYDRFRKEYGVTPQDYRKKVK